MNALWRIELLGGLRAQQGERTITRFRTQKTGALLAYLAFHRDRLHPREVLFELLWPECAPEAGRRSLRVALSSLRHQLEPPGGTQGAVIIADRNTVRLNPAAVATDVIEFEAALQSAARAKSSVERVQHLTDAVELYRGPLLPDYYEDWILLEKQRLEELFFETLRELLTHLAEAGDVNRALHYALKGVSVDPLRGEAHRDLMRLYVAAGQPDAALHQFHGLERILKETFGDAPEGKPQAATRELARQIANRDEGLEMRDEGQPLHRHPSSLILHPSSPLPTGTVTFLLTDIEGSTALWEKTGDAFKKALSDHHALLRQVFRQHGGFEVKEMGDAFLVALERPSDAVACAVACQRALAKHGWSEAVGALRVRIALHTGEVELKDGEYHGLVLHHAQRMLVAGHGGQSLCSEATAALLQRHLEIGMWLTDLGTYRLRDIETSQRLFQVCYEDMPQPKFPPLNAAAGYASNLPLSFTRFFGRETEIAYLTEILLEGIVSRRDGELVNGSPPTHLLTPSPLTTRLVTLTGVGGSGKTRLALEVARRLVELLHGAVWFVPLADLTDARLMADTVRDALRLSRSPNVEPLEQIVEALSRQPSLLVLDNLEHLIEPWFMVNGQWSTINESIHHQPSPTYLEPSAISLVRTLLERVPTLKCLITSRRRLDVSGEREFFVPPLPTPSGEDTPEWLIRCESVQLFVDRAQAVRPDFQVTKANATAVAELCSRLEGIPLALELAAARIQFFTPAQMLTQLENRFNFLMSRRRDIAERHRTLRAAIDWSYQFLPPAIQRFFARLSVFRGGWTVEAAEQVCFTDDGGGGKTAPSGSAARNVVGPVGSRARQPARCPAMVCRRE